MTAPGCDRCGAALDAAGCAFCAACDDRPLPWSIGWEPSDSLLDADEATLDSDAEVPAAWDASADDAAFARAMQSRTAPLLRVWGVA